ncbi:hypothetical protein ES703_122084 [subsurface metagenome]
MVEGGCGRVGLIDGDFKVETFVLFDFFCTPVKLGCAQDGFVIFEGCLVERWLRASDCKRLFCLRDVYGECLSEVPFFKKLRVLEICKKFLDFPGLHPVDIRIDKVARVAREHRGAGVTEGLKIFLLLQMVGVAHKRPFELCLK